MTRPLQFRLRSIFILTTVIAVVCRTAPGVLARITQEKCCQVKLGSTLEEAQLLLGPGRLMSEDEKQRWSKLLRDRPRVQVVVWRKGQNHTFVEFRNSRAIRQCWPEIVNARTS